MPMIEIMTDRKLSPQQKRTFIQHIAPVLEESIQAPLSRTRIIFYELPPENTKEGLLAANDKNSQEQ